jgi:hypothetical protein
MVQINYDIQWSQLTLQSGGFWNCFYKFLMKQNEKQHF